MNGIAVRAGKGEVYAGSQRGLATSEDRGRSWRFLHGKDYIPRVKGLLDADKLKWDAPSGDALEKLLPEDVITAFHADETGVWVGFQTQGAVLLDPVTLRVKKRVKAFDDKYLRVTSFFRHVDGRLFCATWGKGLFTLTGASVKINRIDVKNGSNFPSAASVPTPKAIQNRMTSL